MVTNRMTHERVNGIKTGYWSQHTKEELVQRLAEFEDIGLEPCQIRKVLELAEQIGGALI